MTLFEDFVFGLIQLWLTAYPQSLTRPERGDGGDSTFAFHLILEEPGRPAMLAALIERERIRLR